MASKLALIERHGTLDEFASAVWRAQAQGFCEAQEAVDVIAAYARELADAPQVVEEPREHECEPVTVNEDFHSINIPASLRYRGDCPQGCCLYFTCMVCGQQHMAIWRDRRDLWLRLSADDERG